MNDDLMIAREIEEIKQALGFPGGPKICTTPLCYNEPARGYVVCLQCLHGESERAEDDYVKAKKRLEKLERQLRK